MQFAAYQWQNAGTDFSFAGRDETVGVLGTHIPGSTPPVLTAETLEEIKLRARAHLGEEPDACLYITDSGGRVHEILTNRKYHDAKARAERRTAIAVALLVFCATCLVATALGFVGGWALIGFVGSAVCYATMLRAGLFNEIEGAFVCEIFLVLGLVLVSVFWA